MKPGFAAPLLAAFMAITAAPVRAQEQVAAQTPPAQQELVDIYIPDERYDAKSDESYTTIRPARIAMLTAEPGSSAQAEAADHYLMTVMMLPEDRRYKEYIFSLHSLSSVEKSFLLEKYLTVLDYLPPDDRLDMMFTVLAHADKNFSASRAALMKLESFLDKTSGVPRVMILHALLKNTEGEKARTCFVKWAKELDNLPMEEAYSLMETYLPYNLSQEVDDLSWSVALTALQKIWSIKDYLEPRSQRSAYIDVALFMKPSDPLLTAVVNRIVDLTEPDNRQNLALVKLRELADLNWQVTERNLHLTLLEKKLAEKWGELTETLGLEDKEIAVRSAIGSTRINRPLYYRAVALQKELERQKQMQPPPVPYLP